MEHSLRFEELNLTKETVYIEMGYGAVSPDKNVRDLVDNLFLVANNIVRPRFYFRMFDGYVNVVIKKYFTLTRLSPHC